MNEELQGIIQEMLDNDESQETINMVIAEYERRNKTGDESGKTAPTDQDMSVDVEQVSNVDLTSDDGSLELSKVEEEKPEEDVEAFGVVDNVVDFFSDLSTAWNQGSLQGEMTDLGIELAGFGIGDDPANDQDVINFIEGKKKELRLSSQSFEMKEFDRIYEEAGGGWWGFLKGAAYNPSTLSSMLVSSISSQLSSIRNSEEVAAAALAGGGVGAAAGAAATFYGFGVGAVPGAIAGAMSASMGMMEAGLTFNELLMEEIGGNINDPGAKDKIKAILDNPEKLQDLKTRARNRGAAIAGIELATMGLAKGLGGKLASKGIGKATRVAAIGGTEIIGGGTGEYVGRRVAGQEMDIKEIGFEAFAGLGSAPLTMSGQVFKFQKAVQSAEIGKKIRESNEYGDIVDAYKSDKDGNFKTNAVDVEISKLSKSSQILDSRVEEQILTGKLTKAEGDVIKQNFRRVQGSVSRIKSLDLTTEQEAQAVDKLAERDKIQNELNELKETKSEAITAGKKEELKVIDNEISEIIKADSKAKVEESSTFAKKAGKAFGIEVIDDLTTADIVKQFDTDETKFSEADGFFKDGKIYINKEVAAETRAVSVGSHELLHGILQNSLMTNKESSKIIQDFRSQLNKKQNAAIDLRANATDKDGNRLYSQEELDNSPDEYLAFFSDAIAKNEIKFDEGLGTMLMDFITPILRKVGFAKIKFNTGKDVYNFMREYDKSIKSGKLSKSIQEDLVPGVTTVDSGDAKLSRSEDASNKVQELYDTQGEAAAFDIIEQFKPITSKIVEKRSEAPGFDRQLLTDEIETGKRGILDLIKEYKPESGVPLAAYINKFLPARAIEASRRILGEEFTDDVTEARGIAAEEVAVEVASTDKQVTSKLRRILGIKQGDAIYNLAKEVSGEILSGDLPGKKVKTAINKEARKSKLRKAVSDLMGTEKAIDQQFLNKNILDIVKALPASDLVKLEREAKVKVLAKQGSRLNVKDAREAVNKGLLPKDTNLKSGPKMSSKLPLTLEQAKKFFTQKRKAGLVNVITETLIKDAAPEVTEGKMQPAKRAKVLSEIDRAPTLKFSLSTKQDLNWSIDEAENRNTSFTIGDKTYNVQLNARDLGADQDADPTNYSLEFDQDGSQELTGKGDQFKAVSIIYNGLIDEIKSNPNIATVSFNALASETSRVKLYDVLLDKLSEELGWTAEKFDYESDGVVDEIGFEMYKPEETAKEKFSKTSIFQAETNLEKILSEGFNDYATETNKKWPALFKSLGIVNLNLNDKAQREKFLEDIVSTGLASKFPKSFWRNFQGTSTSVSEMRGDVKFYKMQDGSFAPGVLVKGKDGKTKYKAPKNAFRKYASHVFFLNVADAKAWIEKAESKGIKFAPESDMFKDLLYKEPYTQKVNKKEVLLLNKERFNDVNFINRQENKLKALESIFKTFEKFMAEGKGKNNAALVGGLLKSTAGWQGHFIRKSAPVRFFQTGKMFDADGKKLFTEEHTLPATGIAQYLFIQAASGNISKSFPNVRRNFFQGALLNVNDNKLAGIGVDGKKFSYKEATPEGWTLEDNIWARYFNANVAKQGFGIDPNSLMTYQGKTIFDVYGVDSTGAFIDDNFNNILKNTAKANNLILEPSERFSKSTPFGNSEVLSLMETLDNENTAQESKFSRSLNLSKDFNDIIENKTGIASDKAYARVKAEVVGANKGKWKFFIPPSAEDFVGLLYATLGKGTIGDAQMAWYKAHLLNPFASAMNNLANDRATLMQDFRALKKNLKIVPKNLRKKIPGEPFTQEQAVRAYIWDQQGMEIPGMSEQDQKDLVSFVEKDSNLKSFAAELMAINKGDAYAAPDAGWVAGTIDTDLMKGLNTTKRIKYLEVWQQNVDQIFSDENLNKLEAAYGKEYRVAMENILQRMQTGRNRSFGTDTITGRFTDWLTNSVGAIMFFNTRSAVLQTISAINFINFSDNNVLKAGQAFANQPQYWKDFVKLFNSPFLLDRRSGIKINVNEADIAEMAKGPGNSARNVIAGLLKLGFLPTQIADSFAIASGGATFYRNRIKALMKEGLSQAEAEESAFRDFREIAEESQQSSRPDKISQQQAGPLGRVVLAFANTPAQYARLIKKAASDLKNGRGDAKTNISKIIYYGVAQNLLFSALQQALFAIAFDDDEEEEKKNEKYFNIVNGMSDSILRGIGVGGAIVSVVKNTAIRLAKEADKKSPKYQDAVVKGVLQISPPISSKIGKLQSAGRSFSWNQEEMRTKGWSIDNPAYLASANVISAASNVPLDRAVKKITNLVDSSNDDTEFYKRIALALGWSAWELGIEKNKKTKTKKRGRSRTRTNRTQRTRKKRN